MKSSGNRSTLRRTAWLRVLVSTWYSAAKPVSRMTFWPRMTRMSDSIGRVVVRLLAGCLDLGMNPAFSGFLLPFQ
jgi:hypothetical protein